ncbi:hypothetical protein C8R45DRAFT_1072355 [Mycena sanguinolenta]|nr:hypothetical protein C8R45DRAFT_1072355 [Mycena sanguinolenta]
MMVNGFLSQFFLPTLFPCTKKPQDWCSVSIDLTRPVYACSGKQPDKLSLSNSLGFKFWENYSSLTFKPASTRMPNRKVLRTSFHSRAIAPATKIPDEDVQEPRIPKILISTATAGSWEPSTLFDFADDFATTIDPSNPGTLRGMLLQANRLFHNKQWLHMDICWHLSKSDWPEYEAYLSGISNFPLWIPSDDESVDVRPSVAPQVVHKLGSHAAHVSLAAEHTRTPRQDHTVPSIPHPSRGRDHEGGTPKKERWGHWPEMVLLHPGPYPDPHPFCVS